MMVMEAMSCIRRATVKGILAILSARLWRPVREFLRIFSEMRPLMWRSEHRVLQNRIGLLQFWPTGTAVMQHLNMD